MMFEHDVKVDALVYGEFQVEKGQQRQYQIRRIRGLEKVLGKTIVRYEILYPEGNLAEHDLDLQKFINSADGVIDQPTDYTILRKGWRYYIPAWSAYFDVLAVIGPKITYKFVDRHSLAKTNMYWDLCRMAFNEFEPTPSL